MAQTQQNQNLAFSRLVHPDPVTNRIIQDIYDKLAYIQSAITAVSNQPAKKP